MEIVEFGPDDGDVIDEVVELDNAVLSVDSPWVHPSTRTTVRGLLRYGWDGEPPRCFVARESGSAVGLAEIWASDWDNTDLAWFDLLVHPEHRRRGLGGALMGCLLDRSRDVGRTKVGIDAWDAEPPRRFAASWGFELGSQAINRRQVLATSDRTDVQRMYAGALEAASDYELLRLPGRTPPELLVPVAVMTAAINDAPTDDLDIEDELFPPERIRAYEDACLGRGLRLYRLVARHLGSGALAGQTVVAVDAERPAIADQHDTSVVRAHRGHRLGMLLKAGMLGWLAEDEPQVETVDTWNAESNDHMIRVNDELGYRVLGRGLQFQRKM